MLTTSLFVGVHHYIHILKANLFMPINESLVRSASTLTKVYPSVTKDSEHSF